MRDVNYNKLKNRFKVFIIPHFCSIFIHKNTTKVKIFQKKKERIKNNIDDSLFSYNVKIYLFLIMSTIHY